MQEQILDSKLSDYEKTFFHSKWRPALAWSYLFVILMDFVFLPIIFISLGADANTFNWEPLTLKGSGIYHVSMLTIVGVTAYGRTKEKLERDL